MRCAGTANAGSAKKEKTMTKESFAAKWRLLAMALVIALVGGWCTVLPSAHAAETGSITVDFNVTKNGKDTPIQNAEFNLYKIGVWDGTKGKYVPVAPFDNEFYSSIGMFDETTGTEISIVDIIGASAEQLRGLSDTLSAKIKQADAEDSVDNKAEPVMTRYTHLAEEGKDSGGTTVLGQAVFDGLERGLYLVDAPIHQIAGTGTTAQGKIENDKYVISSSLVGLPSAGDDDPMNVTISAKADCATGVDPIHVEKVCKNDDPATRPKSITVSLYLEGQDDPIGTETLSEENDWKCVWDNLPVGDRYFVVEDEVPEGYKVFIDEDIINPETADFTITNSKPSKPNEPTVPVSTTTPNRPSTAHTGAEVASIVAIAVACVMIALVLIREVRRSRDK